MNDNNTDTAASAALAAAAAPAKPKKVQHTITVTERDKEWLKDLQGEFYGPQASDPEKPRYLSTEEAFSVLRTVAENNRWTKEQQSDEDGNPVYDEDGEPVMIDVDRFEVVAKEIIAAREFGRSSPSKKVSELEAKIAALEAEIAAREAALAAANA